MSSSEDFVEIDSTVCNGLPCSVRGVYRPAEPDVGLMTGWVEDVTFHWGSGHEFSKKMYERVSEDDISDAEAALLNKEVS